MRELEREQQARAGTSRARARKKWLLLCSMLSLLVSSSNLHFKELMLWALPESFSLADLCDWLLRRRGGGSRVLTRSPWGVGDCAAPKLLHAARELGLRPTGLAEVWHEALSLRPSRCAASDEMPRSAAAAAASGLARTRRKHGSFHAACAERCEPIMGFMLCGAEADPDGGPGQR